MVMCVTNALPCILEYSRTSGARRLIDRMEGIDYIYYIVGAEVIVNQEIDCRDDVVKRLLVYGKNRSISKQTSIYI